ncbi:sigma-70 family RNA polymerase sigma factor [Marivivens aquimaris]|uniref:sigma-70 family RNA polymerase sigma factor n=1 Tax=Marivivens aquimaris TaxID=2774876 RepID=UPI0018811EBD|nr:sigma-70 family RNA polymerase sigma factor [Marivivens aquimaris]
MRDFARMFSAAVIGGDVAASDDDSNILLVDIARGSRDAFDRFYELHAGLAFGVVLRVVRDRSLAEDILQDVFVKVWRSAGQFDRNRSAATTWLVTIARNAAIDNVRRSQRRVVTTQINEWNGGNDKSSEDEMMLTDDKRVLAICLDELEGKQRWAVGKAYLEGFTYQELAVAMDAPLNTVRSWLRRSLHRLRLCLEERQP